MITIGTAECFTHGKIAQEIHSFSRGYPSAYPWKIDAAACPVALVAGLFIPTMTGIRTVLGFEPLPPPDMIGDIKVYNQEQDREMAVMMAYAVRRISGADIGIGTTAGVGEGGIAVICDRGIFTGTSSVHADLRLPDTGQILARQKAGISRCLGLLEGLLIKESGSDEVEERNHSWDKNNADY